MAGRIHSLRPLALALVAQLLVALTVVASPAGAASSPEYVGVNTQPLMKDAGIDTSRWDSYLTQLQVGRMGISRVEIDWRFVELTAPVNGVHTYNWNYGGDTSRMSTDFQMLSLAKRGVRASPLFATVPSWASKNPYRMTSVNYPDFATWIAAFATRYGPGGAFWAEHPEVKALPPQDYEIWTEANSTNFWTGSPNPAEYANALKQIKAALTVAQPSAVLLPSVGWQNINTYLDGFFAAGGGEATDGIGFHPYAPHAPAIAGLVTGLRTKLQSLGKGDVPIMITETGQPVTYTGAGAASAGSGTVTDAARAATQTFAADWFARSNCGVEQFLIYAITGSETNKEPIGEGFMGVLRHADGTPNLTGGGLQRLSVRWAEQAAAGNPARNTIQLCGGTTPDDHLLPLGLVLTRSGTTCVVGRTTYDGNPLEGSRLEFIADGRATYSQENNAFGRAEVCLTDGPKVATFDVVARVPNAARSARYRCDLPVTGCVEVSPAPNPPGSNPTLNDGGNGDDGPVGDVLCACGGQLPAPTAQVKACSWAATLLVGRPTRKAGASKSTVVGRGRLTCATKPSKQKFRFVVAIRKKGKKKDTKLRTVTLSSGRTVKFTAKGKFRKGDKLVLLHTVAKKPKDVLPRLRVAATLKSPKVVKAKKKTATTTTK